MVQMLFKQLIIENIQLVVLLDYYVSCFVYLLIIFNWFIFLDIASGSSVDWAYDVLKIPFSNSIELPPTNCKFFWNNFFLK
jgi:hypothetical protein